MGGGEQEVGGDAVGAGERVRDVQHVRGIRGVQLVGGGGGEVPVHERVRAAELGGVGEGELVAGVQAEDGAQVREECEQCGGRGGGRVRGGEVGEGAGFC